MFGWFKKKEQEPLWKKSRDRHYAKNAPPSPARRPTIVRAPQAKRQSGHAGPGLDRVPWVRRSGVVITPETAVTLSAVFRAVTFISQTFAILPWGVYEDHEAKTKDPVYYLIRKRPNSEMSPFEFKRLLVSHILLWGNGYAEIEFNNGGVPIGLWPLPPDSVEPRRDESGALFYRVSGRTSIGNTGWVDIPASHIFHVKNIGSDGIVGWSTIGLAARSIGLGIAAEEFGSTLYKNQAIPSGVLTHPRQLTDEAVVRLRNQFIECYSGPHNAGKPILLEEGMEFSALSMKPEDLQFIESRKFAVTDVAAWFGVPPHKLGDMTHSTFSNIEHLSIEVVNDVITPLCKVFEEEADFKLLGRRRTDVYTKLELRGLLRGDFSSRMEGYAKGLVNGIWNVNECRGWEDLGPVPGGDRNMVQAQMIPLEEAGLAHEEEHPETETVNNASGIQDTEQG